jgi:hypothetical protein
MSCCRLLVYLLVLCSFSKSILQLEKLYQKVQSGFIPMIFHKNNGIIEHNICWFCLTCLILISLLRTAVLSVGCEIGLIIWIRVDFVCPIEPRRVADDALLRVVRKITHFVCTFDFHLNTNMKFVLRDR